ncbi:MAG: methyltransferase domain-containing protein [Proteobacteria bacterium]|nr:methyltransferase domain-containing protein [Pseudomonadota bacterium]
MRKRETIAQLAEHALRLAQVGEFDGAAAFFEQAIALDSSNFDLQYNLAIVEENLGHIGRAASLLIQVLQRKPPSPFAAAARLSRLLTRYRIDDSKVIAPAGLVTALQTRDVALQPLTEAGLQWLSTQNADWRDGIGRIASGELSELDSGRAMLGKLRHLGRAEHEMLCLCLREGIVKSIENERLLTGMRAALLIGGGGKFLDDRDHFNLALALMVQGWNNDHAWAETSQETAALAALKIDRAALLVGDMQATRAFLCAALYRPLEQIVTPPLGAEDMRALKPKSFRETLSAQIMERAARDAAAKSIPAVGALCDETSLKVARQYEASPYPRWKTVQQSAPGALQRYLSRLMPADRFAFMDGECDILIAGCGTGQQALMSATAHGPKARLLAIDISRASLAYASVMAAREKVTNVSFVQVDILDVAQLGRCFDVIYCVGVLHHMADWRVGWRALLSCLKPSGLMNIALYSATARQGLRDLRDDKDYPGAGCTDAAARVYRRLLLLRADETPASYVRQSRDFFALNTFRDLVLHESEATVTIEEIAQFLDDEGLVFRGFTLDKNVLQEFATMFPAAAPAGTLADWAAFEQLKPHTFDGMYYFWVEREEKPAVE